MKKGLRQSILIGGIVLTLMLIPAQGKTISKAPANIQASLFIKLLPYNKNITRGGDVVIYVLSTPPVAKAMKSAIGRKIGKSRLVDIISIETIPKEKPAALAVLYINEKKHIKASKAFCRKYKILSITGNPELMKQGITLTVGIENKKAKILLNLEATQKEGVDWNPDILKIATKVK